MICDVCCVDQLEDHSVRRRDEDHVLCDRCEAAYHCRWLDICCVECRNPSWMSRMPGVFSGPICRRADGCGYEQIDDEHTAWNARDE